MAGNVITLLATTDEHGFLDRAARVQAYIDKVRSEQPDSTVVVSCGDVYEGAAVSELERYRTALEVMGDYQVVGCGNHDFAQGKAFVQEWANRGGYTVLGANVLDSTTGRPLEGVASHTVLEAGGYKVGFLGVVTVGAGSLNRAEDVAGLAFSDPVAAGQQAAQALKAEGAELTVALTHLTPAEDERFNSTLQGIDFALGGHTHESYREPDTTGLFPFAKGGTARRHLVRVDFRMDPATRRVAAYDYQLIKVDDLPEPEDSPVKRLVAATTTRVDAALAQPVARLAQAVPHDRSDESPLLRLIGGEIQRATGAQVVMFDRGQVRRGLEAGLVTVGDMLDVAPFQTMIVTAEVPRERVLEALEESSSRRDNTRLFVARSEELPPVVTVATTTYLAKGNAGYFRAGELPWSCEGPVVREFLEGALQRQGPVEGAAGSAQVLAEAGLGLRAPR